MLEDIFYQPQKAVIDKKQYSFEYDHAAMAMLEKKTGKSPYEIYDILMSKNQVMLSDSLGLVSCALMKHHSEEEILEMEKKLREYPGLWFQMKEYVTASFIFPMLPPEVLREMQGKEYTKKKVLKKKTTNG